MATVRAASEEARVGFASEIAPRSLSVSLPSRAARLPGPTSDAFGQCSPGTGPAALTGLPCPPGPPPFRLSLLRWLPREPPTGASARAVAAFPSARPPLGRSSVGSWADVSAPSAGHLGPHCSLAGHVCAPPSGRHRGGLSPACYLARPPSSRSHVWSSSGPGSLGRRCAGPGFRLRTL